MNKPGKKNQGSWKFIEIEHRAKSLQPGTIWQHWQENGFVHAWSSNQSLRKTLFLKPTNSTRDLHLVVPCWKNETRSPDPSLFGLGWGYTEVVTVDSCAPKQMWFISHWWGEAAWYSIQVLVKWKPLTFATDDECQWRIHQLRLLRELSPKYWLPPIMCSFVAMADATNSGR